MFYLTLEDWNPNMVISRPEKMKIIISVESRSQTLYCPYAVRDLSSMPMIIQFFQISSIFRKWVQIVRLSHDLLPASYEPRLFGNQEYKENIQGEEIVNGQCNY